MIDPINLVFYATVCGALAVVVPQGKSRIIRAVFGAIVGILASGFLPYLKTLIGG